MTTRTVGRTKTPWKYGGQNSGEIYAVESGTAICQMQTSQVGDIWPDEKAERKVNAAFIVQCVNAHDALVEALETALPVIGLMVAKDLAVRVEFENFLRKTYAALALAKGE